MINHFKKIILYISLIIIFKNAFALSNDMQQTLYIVADYLSVNYKTGIRIYEGSVKIDQGSSHLTADRVVTKNGNNKKLEEAIAYGIKKLAEYTTVMKEGNEIIVAKAKIIKFYPLKEQIILEGEAIVTQGKNSFQGPVIIYNTKDQIVTAPASKEGRSTIIIEPKQFKI